MTYSHNDVTGDLITQHKKSPAYYDNYDAIFRKKDKKDVVEESHEEVRETDTETTQS